MFFNLDVTQYRFSLDDIGKVIIVIVKADIHPVVTGIAPTISMYIERFKLYNLAGKLYASVYLVSDESLSAESSKNQ